MDLSLLKKVLKNTDFWLERKKKKKKIYIEFLARNFSFFLKGTSPILVLIHNLKALAKNPVIACRAFRYRLDAIFKYIIKGSSCPMGMLQDEWIRIEFQGRGSLHAHIILWLGTSETHTTAHCEYTQITQFMKTMV